ncbi:hypothetical protein P3911_004475 [Salmonella enterica]|nr:hypothetical protein [Salmonella enterica]
MAVIERGVFLDKTVTNWNRATLRGSGFGYWHIIVDNLVMGRIHPLQNTKFQLWLDGKRINVFDSKESAFNYVITQHKGK